MFREEQILQQQKIILWIFFHFLHNQVSETLTFTENTLWLLNHKTEIFQNPDLIYTKKIRTHGCKLRFY